jgi:proteasome lid subunit RPN8/RPN11
MATVIARHLYERILAHVAAEPEREVCGLLFGGGGRIVAVEPSANVAPNPADSFEVDPRALFAALRTERAGGAPLIGHYHSHPNGRAEPSPRDAAAAEPGRLWLIVARGTARAWFAEPGGLFTAQALDIV